MKINTAQISKNNQLLPTTWRVDRQKRVVYLDNGYTLSFENKKQAWHIKDARGNDVRIWGDPHVHENDGGKWNFKDQMTFKLADGTKITVKTKPVGNGGATVSDKLVITKGDQAIQVTGIAENRVEISPITPNGGQLDRDNADGFLAQEMGGVDNWGIGGREIMHDLPDNDDIRLQQLYEFITPPQGEKLPPNYGLKSGESLPAKFGELESEMTSRLQRYRDVQKRQEFGPYSKFFEDLVHATEEDSNELKQKKNRGSRPDQIRLYNRLIQERSLQIKYNINLTSQGTEWSEGDLSALDEELKKIPSRFTVLEDKMRTVRLEAMRPGSGGHNNGHGLIALPPGGIRWALIHEVAHNLDDENPRWGDFKGISGWREATANFRSISGDDINGTYQPYNGRATLLRDGKTYHDGDRIDLNGDGTIDGIAQIHYGRVMIHNEGGGFLSAYASVHPYEDFAETFKYFFTNPSRVWNASREKYRFMAEYTGVNPLNR